MPIVYRFHYFHSFEQGTLVTSFSTDQYYKDINTLKELDESGLEIGTSSGSLKNLFGEPSLGTPLIRSLASKYKMINTSTPIITRAAYERDICAVERLTDIRVIIAVCFGTFNWLIISITTQYNERYLFISFLEAVRDTRWKCFAACMHHSLIEFRLKINRNLLYWKFFSGNKPMPAILFHVVYYEKRLTATANFQWLHSPAHRSRFIHFQSHWIIHHSNVFNCIFLHRNRRFMVQPCRVFAHRKSTIPSRGYQIQRSAGIHNGWRANRFLYFIHWHGLQLHCVRVWIAHS